MLKIVQIEGRNKEFKIYRDDEKIHTSFMLTKAKEYIPIQEGSTVKVMESEDIVKDGKKTSIKVEKIKDITNMREATIVVDAHKELNIVEFVMGNPTILNKFPIIMNFISGISKLHGEKFDDWFEHLLTEYMTVDYEHKLGVLIKNFNRMKNYVGIGELDQRKNPKPLL